ncbi:uncharacterized protein [Palaemon carinicauda]|uniref:uncharacterized protein n=1 Tax=Palaemon carinicauda TaxID=392227 RepID=UPI0035B5EA73
MINTFFEKKINRLITYSRGGRESHIDLMVCKRDHLKEVRNCEVINGESIAVQHRLVVIDYRPRNYVWESLGEEGIDILLDLIQKIFNQEKMPEEWRGRLIIPIYKGNRDIQEYGNYRGISQIIWEKIIERRLRDETTMGEEPFGFMPGTGTVYAIFTLRQMIEKHQT